MKSIRYHRAGGKAEQLERSHRLRDRIRRQGDAPEGRCISGTDEDGEVTLDDAFRILSYYSLSAAGREADWEKV